jgi:hypothetical protein
MPDATALTGKHQLRPDVDAFFQDMNWEEVDRRLERAAKMSADPRW